MLPLKTESLFPASVLPTDAQTFLAKGIRDKLKLTLSGQELSQPILRFLRPLTTSERTEPHLVVNPQTKLVALTERPKMEGTVSANFGFAMPETAARIRSSRTGRFHQDGPFTIPLAASTLYMRQESLVLANQAKNEPLANSLGVYSTRHLADGMGQFIGTLTQEVQSGTTESLALILAREKAKIRVTPLSKTNDPRRLNAMREREAGVDAAVRLLGQLLAYGWMNQSFLDQPSEI